MSFNRMGLDLVQSYGRWEAGRRRQLQGNVKSAGASSGHRVLSTLTKHHDRSSHVTRILGKICFSCDSVNALSDKFCEQCGAPLFRPASQQLPQPNTVPDVAS